MTMIGRRELPNKDKVGNEDRRAGVEPKGHSQLKSNETHANPKRKKQRPATIGAQSLKQTHDPLGH